MLVPTFALLWGCVGPYSTRATRDAELLALTAPRAPIAKRDQVLRAELEEMPEVAVGPSVDFEKRTPVPLELQEALRIALQQSGVVRIRSGQSVVAARDTFFDIQARQAGITEELAQFDTTFRTDLFSRNINRPPDAFFGPGLAQPLQRDELALNFGWTKRTTWGGTTVATFNPQPGYLFIPDSTDGFNPRLVGQWEMSVVQPLLRNSGRAVNIAPIEISQILTEQSAWDFKKTVMTSVQSIVAAYWDLHAARVAVESVEAILPVLEEIVRLQNAALDAQWVTKTEVAKAEAQLYGFRQDYQLLQSEALATELRLRNLIGLPPNDGRTLIVTTPPLDQDVQVDPQSALRAALDNQPDLVRQRLDVRIRTVEHMLAANATRCQLDVFALSRLNGIGEDLGDALDQMSSAEFVDWELGTSFSVPLGRRQANAQVRAAQQRLAKEKVLLEQSVFSLQHDLESVRRSVEYAYREYQEATRRLTAADQWVEGARIRYENPELDDSGTNWLIQNLNEYLNALRFRTDSATDKASVLARYNSELARLEQTKGTLLSFYGIDFLADPCRQSAKLQLPQLTFLDNQAVVPGESTRPIDTDDKVSMLPRPQWMTPDSTISPGVKGTTAKKETDSAGSIPEHKELASGGAVQADCHPTTVPADSATDDPFMRLSRLDEPTLLPQPANKSIASGDTKPLATSKPSEEARPSNPSQKASPHRLPPIRLLVE